jgi:hypothetical protein
MQNVEEIQFVDVNPLDEAVNEKRYSQPNINTSGIDFNKPIDEPTFTPPPFKKTPNPGSQQSGNSGQSGSSNSKSSSSSEEPMSKKDQRLGAEAAADMVIQGYVWMHDLGNKWLQISEKRLNRLQEAGEINLNAMIDYDYGHRITAGEFIQEYNKQVSNILQVSDEFKEEARKLLTEYFEKKNVKITLEQRIMILFAKDIAAKGMIIFQQKQQVKQMLSVISEATARQAAPPPPPPPPPPTPQPTPEPEKNDTIVVEPEEFEVDNAVVVAKKKRGRPKKYGV